MEDINDSGLWIKIAAGLVAIIIALTSYVVGGGFNETKSDQKALSLQVATNGNRITALETSYSSIKQSLDMQAQTMERVALGMVRVEQKLSDHMGFAKSDKSAKFYPAAPVR
jgi:heterodisulfide reductase subunit C